MHNQAQEQPNTNGMAINGCLCAADRDDLVIIPKKGLLMENDQPLDEQWEYAACLKLTSTAVMQKEIVQYMHLHHLPYTLINN